ncbi:MAG TPA: M14 family zinc carboxypeptidase [Chloroflexia bacterium]|nr:M14 family zinc carboxypeptidase [Chloroflexia bacterium]
MIAKRIAHLNRLALGVSLALLLLPLLLAGSVATVTRAALPITNQSAINHASTEWPTLVLRVYFRDTVERDRLATELAAEEVPTLGGYLTVIGDGDTYTRLLARGLRVEVDQAHTEELKRFTLSNNTASTDNTESHILSTLQTPRGHPKSKIQNSQTLNGDTFFGGYLTVSGIEAFLDQMAAHYPGLVEKLDIGDSWCKTHTGQCVLPKPHNGHDLWVLHITNRAIPGPKPVFWFDAGIHSREVATPEVAMRFVSHLLDGYNTDADAHWLVDYHDIWVMPLFNPDGHFTVEAGAGSDAPYSQRKNADNDDGCSYWPPKDVVQFGTDLNRNFPFKWGCCRGSTLAPCEQTYRGPSESSEEETAAVTAKIRELVPDQRGPADTDAAPLLATGVYQNLHSFADLNLYPWGWMGEPAPNGADLENIAAHMSAQDAGGNGYDYCQAPNCLYVSDGTANDWGYGELGMLSITTELSGGSFFPLHSEVDRLWGENKGELLYLSKIARTPFLTTRGPDANSVTTGLAPVTQGAPAQLTATINYAWTGNSYLQNVAAAEYYIDIPPWAGGTPLPLYSMDGGFDSPTETVIGAMDTTSLTPGRHVVFVRGRGVTDYDWNELTLQSWGPFSAAWLVVAQPGTQLEGVSHRPSGSRPGR